MTLFGKFEFLPFCACAKKFEGLKTRFPNVQSMRHFWGQTTYYMGDLDQISACRHFFPTNYAILRKIVVQSKKNHLVL